MMNRIFITLLLLTLDALGYVYPKGIPEAWIAPDVAAPARPSDWSSPVAGYYFIDYATGTDSGRTYGTPTAPRKTIPSTISAGSRVEVSGTYNPTAGTWFITFAGDSGAWVANTSGPAWLTGTDANTPASFSGTVHVVGSYGCIQYVNNFVNHKGWNTNSPTAGLGRTGNHLLIRYSEFQGTASVGDGNGFSIHGNSDVGGAGSHVVFYSNEVHDFGIPEPNGTDPDYISVYVTNYANNIWILDNELHDNSGSGLQLGGNTTNTPYITYVYAGRNHCYNLWGTGMASKTAQYIVYSENHVHDIKDNAEISRSKGIAGQYAATDQWIIFNNIHDCAYGILRVSGNGGIEETCYIIGNAIWDIYPLGRDYTPHTDAPFGAEAGISIWGADHAWIVNNTLSEVPNAITEPLQVQDIKIVNNIITSLNEDTGQYFFGENSGSLKSITIENNLFYEAVNDIEFQFPGESVMNVATLNASAYGESNSSGDPLLTNPATGDFTIPTGSPAKDAGSATLIDSLEASYLATFGVSVSFDKAGVSRPQNGIYDIGAHEFGTGTITATTLNATTLNVGP